MSVNEILLNDVMLLKPAQKLAVIDEILKNLYIHSNELELLWANRK